MLRLELGFKTVNKDVPSATTETDYIRIEEASTKTPSPIKLGN